MNLEQLQQKFGISNLVRFAEGRGGLVKALLRHASGARAEIYLHGAHFQDGAPIRGGIPVVFPQFGDGLLPKHGLARSRAWQVARTALEADGAVTIMFQLEDDAQTRTLWPHPFCLQLTVSLGPALTLDLTVKNPGAAPLPFQAAYRDRSLRISFILDPPSRHGRL